MEARVLRSPLFLLILALLLLGLASTAISAAKEVSTRSGGQIAILVKIDGLVSTIDEPTYNYVVKQGLHLAEEENVPLIVVVNSYGGYMDTMFKIANAFFNARVPVIGYVPDKAFSAACIILLPMHIVAVGPTATIGAAQPIMINPVTGQVTFINESKIINPLVAKISLWARVRGRNVTAATAFVEHNLVLVGKEAVKVHIANLVAYSLQDLIRKIDGWRVNITVNGQVVKTYTIHIVGYRYVSPSISVIVFAILRNSVVQSILWFLGVFGTFAAILSGRFEILPLTVVLLLLAIIGAGGFGVNFLAIGLIILGAILLGIELFVTPGFGVLGASGIIALIFGLLLLPAPAGRSLFMVNINEIRIVAGIVGGSLGAFFTFIMYKAVQAKRRKPSISYVPEKAIGRAVDRIEPGKPGTVFVEGEYWTAESDEVIEPGEEVEVVERIGFRLRVRKVRREEKGSSSSGSEAAKEPR